MSKKIARSLGRGEVGDAARHEKSNEVALPLDHIIKERYPTFVDALRDLDDALTLLFLFANLPSTSTVPHKIISLCQRLTLEFSHYVITSHTLRKTFLSIKGIYYQATIHGQDIMWLVPYKFVQRVTGDVDFRIMGTFVEFYTTLLGFVNYRLYTEVGLVYPPRFNAEVDEAGGELAAFTLEGKNIEEQKSIEANGDGQELDPELQRQIESISEQPTLTDDTEPQIEEPTETAIDTFNPIDPLADTLLQPAPPSSAYENLFADITVFISREAPKSALEFLFRAFGCKRIGWPEILGEGAWTNNEWDAKITHQVVDRPAFAQAPVTNDGEAEGNGEEVVKRTEPMRMLNRIYVQPQWVWDSINSLKLLRSDLYAPGAMLPPHLSPWVKPREGGYDPTAPLNGASASDGEKLTPAPTNGATRGENEDEEQEADEAESEEDEDVADDQADASESDAGSFAGFDGGSEDDIELQHQRELEAEAKGVKPKARETRSKTSNRAEKEKEEDLERRKMLLTRKKRKLYDRAMHSKRKTDAGDEKLRSKRAKVEKGST